MLIGTRNQRILRRYAKQVSLINEIEKQLWNQADRALVEKTQGLKERVRRGVDLDQVLVEAFALVKTVCRRLVGERLEVCAEAMSWELVPYDVQLLGAIALAQGKIVEMATGEGKTLAATFPLFLNALMGRGAHLATANDYLALRDSQWMGKIFSSLGLRVGCLQAGMTLQQRKEAYQADVTYGAGKEFGFDYLRDHSLAHSSDEMVQRGHFYAIVDEVDSVLIDEARTPLIISGAPVQGSGVYKKLKPVIEGLIQRQRKVCDGFLDEVSRQRVEDFSLEQEGIKLFLVSKGDPANPRLISLLQDYRVAQMIREAEIFLMKDFLKRKRIKEAINQNLFYVVEQKNKNCYLTDQAISHLSEQDESQFVLPDIVHELQVLDTQEDISEPMKLQHQEEILGRYEARRENIHALANLLKAYTLFRKDVDYCIQHQEIVLVDVFTGRLMQGRRYTDGLHQALEAKEDLSVSPETHLVATVSTQNYFRLYEKLAGMTGTAVTSANEFKEIYRLEVVRIPTHKPVRRRDEADVFFRKEEEKLQAIVEEIHCVYQTGRPVLVGTVSIEKSEKLSNRLKEIGIPHQVLNARYHLEEARIIARAGRKFAVTIATNMAGRGTDIRIDPDLQGGLHVIGTERHESRRIDHQLRGRSGRQGDPGSSQFLVSLEDELLRHFGAGRLVKAMKFLTLPMFKTISRPFLEKLMSLAQSEVELRNFNLRKRLLEFDDVVYFQRRIVYQIRRDLLCEDDPTTCCTPTCVGGPDDHRGRPTRPTAGGGTVLRFLQEIEPDENWQDLYKKAREKVGRTFEVVERLAFLGILDQYWVQHLSDLERLREGIGFRSLAQTNLVTEFKREGFTLFSSMMKEMAKAFGKALL